MISEDDHQLILAWANLAQVHTVMRTELTHRLQDEAGLTLAEHELLFRLSRAPDGRLRMIDLAELTLQPKSAITRLVERLVLRGAVTRHQPADNRRVTYAVLTTEGRALFDRARPVYIQGVRDLLEEHLAPADVQFLRQRLRDILTGQDTWTDERCDPQPLGVGPSDEIADDATVTFPR
ncbi:MarR family winged helix-turn-helix transcriptional regulator [Nonomuraea diastatica]|uniref:MarR family transcriptional regulator n=1 Tax=Nonomuraea diastatica TaxID=1848329 RepID=A0A4R4VQ18_9ACTN|nr:MarR family transcriptional regulator [Nonomuraea diastatica]TDD08018.1 MarR family transcriptional regulator [Nonomuraea diastatica]